MNATCQNSNALNNPPQGTVGVVWVYHRADFLRENVWPYEYVGSSKIPTVLQRIDRESDKQLAGVLAISESGKSLGVAIPAYYGDTKPIGWGTGVNVEWLSSGEDLDNAKKVAVRTK